MKQSNFFKVMWLLALSVAVFSCEIEDEDDEYGPSNGQNITNGGTRYQNTIFMNALATRNVSFGSAEKTGGGTEQLEMTIFQGDGDTQANRPVVILAPGGGFSDLGFQTMEAYAQILARAGFVAGVINYRLNESNDRGEERMMLAVVQAVQDMKAAVRFFRKDADSGNQYKVNPNKIFVGGYSAGAVTALHLAYLEGTSEAPAALASIIDANGGWEGNSGNPGYSSAVSGVINLAGGILDTNFIDAGEPALYSVHGTSDQVVSYNSGPADGTPVVLHGSQPMHAQAQSVGISSELLALTGGDHSAPADIKCGSCNVRLLGFLYNQLQ